MKRKLVRQGGSALTISLPARWVKENSLAPGQEVECSIDSGDLIISKEGKKKRKEASINIDGYNYLNLSRHILMLYRTNFDKIEITYSKLTIEDPKKERDTDLKKIIKKITDRLIGAEIVTQTNKRTEIECFVSENEPDLDKIEKRVYFLMKETVNEILEAIGRDYHEFHKTMYDHHDNISKFINYYLRELHISKKSYEEKKIGYVFYMILDSQVDKLRHLSEKIDKFGCSKKAKEYLRDIFEIYFSFFESIRKGKIKEETIEKRYRLKEEMDKDKLTEKDLRVLANAMIFLDVLNESSEYTLVKRMEDGKTDNI